MKIEYSKTGSSIKPFVIPDDVLADMGRLIRACTEIEDIIGLHLCGLASIGEAESVVLLGRLPSSAKLKMATVLAHALGGETAKVHDRCFDNEGFREIIRCRNTIAHGLLLGQNDEGGIAFRTVDTVGADEAGLTLNVISYELPAVRERAEIAENSIPALERLLKLETWRKERRARELLPHRKSQAKGKRGAKQKRPPRSSRKSPQA
jgi:hypothetical protein